jgi:hypothetical protein
LKLNNIKEIGNKRIRKILEPKEYEKIGNKRI